MPASSAPRTWRTTWSCRAPSRRACRNAARKASSSFSSTIRPKPIGVWLELAEDQKGLYARGRLMPEVARAREVLSLMRAGALDGLSIGFRTVKGAREAQRHPPPEKIDLWEISSSRFRCCRRRASRRSSPDRSPAACRRSENSSAGSRGMLGSRAPKPGRSSLRPQIARGQAGRCRRARRRAGTLRGDPRGDPAHDPQPNGVPHD